MASSGTEPPPPAAPSDYIRLHITPLNPALLPSIVSTSILPLARNISYHTLQTFPEKAYGFVELPVVEAEKIKKKLNGAILKGTKVRIEEARPHKELMMEEEIPTTHKVKKDKSLKKRTRDTETVPAIELTDRKVKRGWTDPEAPARSEKRAKHKKDKKEKKEAVRSKYTTGPECLFRTSLPANVAVENGVVDVKSDRKRRGKGKDTVVHEFSKSVKHATFLRDNAVPSGNKGVAEYVEGTGWVNQDGEVVEAPTTKSRKSQTSRAEAAEDSTDSAASSEIENESDDESLAEIIEALRSAPEKKASKREQVVVDSTTSSGGSSEDDSEAESDSTSESSGDDKALTPTTPNDASRPVSASGAPSGLTISIPKNTSEPESGVEVHPLEALYKRRRPDLEGLKVDETPPSFSFFGADEDEDENNQATVAIPMTPFTQQDFAHRGLRSAAPTPDTAHPSRAPHIRWPSGNDADEVEVEEEKAFQTPSQKKKTSKAADEPSTTDPNSDFHKWFYEHRGESNRAWKKEKKEVAKEKRQRENKKRSGRAS